MTQGLFRGYLLLGYQEVTLGANQLYDDWLINKLRWNIAAPALLTNEELQFMRGGTYIVITVMRLRNNNLFMVFIIRRETEVKN